VTFCFRATALDEDLPSPERVLGPFSSTRSGLWGTSPCWRWTKSIRGRGYNEERVGCTLRGGLPPLLDSFLSSVFGAVAGFALGTDWTTKVNVGASLRSWQLGSEFVSGSSTSIGWAGGYQGC
jgi:hypothetical protein